MGVGKKFFGGGESYKLTKLHRYKFTVGFFGSCGERLPTNDGGHDLPSPSGGPPSHRRAETDKSKKAQIDNLNQMAHIRFIEADEVLRD